jgi:c-di-GMP-binding flagellar brake protein YcgR
MIKDRRMVFLKFMISCAFIIFFVSEPVLAEGILDQIGWRDPIRKDPTLVIFLGIIIAAIFFLAYRAWLVTREKIEKRKIRLEEEELSRKEFVRRRRESGLNEREVDLLLSMLKKKKVSKIHTVFESVELFESCVDREIRDLTLKRTLPEKRKEKGMTIMSLREKLGYCKLPSNVPLVSTRNITVGQTGSVYGKSAKVPGRMVLMINRAEIIESGSFTFKLNYDPQKEETCNFLSGEKVSFSFASEGDARYRVSLTVLGSGPSGTIELQHSSSLKRSQSRREFRFETPISVTGKLFKKSIMGDDTETTEGEPFVINTCTISAGGLSFIHDRILRAGDLLKVDFDILETSFTDISLKILCALTYNEELKVFIYHAQFVDIENSTREGIVKLIFEMARRQGLGEDFAVEDEYEELDDGIYIVN